MASLNGLWRLLTSSAYREERKINRFVYKEEKRLINLNEPGETILLGNKVRFNDGHSFMGMKRDIFDRGIYDFVCNTSSPFIIDGGANIGLSVLYFKKLYPDADIIAFEPDPQIFELLQFNINSFALSKTQLVQKALWVEETTLDFQQDGKESGRVTSSKSDIVIKTARLHDFLTKPVHFLKLDIEGAEVMVLKDCADVLNHVEKIFVEYHSFENKDQELDVILRILKDSGFRISVQDNLPRSENPFLKVNKYKDMDLLVNIFGIRK